MRRSAWLYFTCRYIPLRVQHSWEPSLHLSQVSLFMHCTGLCGVPTMPDGHSGFYSHRGFVGIYLGSQVPEVRPPKI